jgi:hypothetical protein
MSTVHTDIGIHSADQKYKVLAISQDSFNTNKSQNFFLKNHT